MVISTFRPFAFLLSAIAFTSVATTSADPNNVLETNLATLFKFRQECQADSSNYYSILSNAQYVITSIQDRQSKDLADALSNRDQFYDEFTDSASFNALPLTKAFEIKEMKALVSSLSAETYIYKYLSREWFKQAQETISSMLESPVSITPSLISSRAVFEAARSQEALRQLLYRHLDPRQPSSFASFAIAPEVENLKPFKPFLDVHFLDTTRIESNWEAFKREQASGTIVVSKRVESFVLDFVEKCRVAASLVRLTPPSDLLKLNRMFLERQLTFNIYTNSLKKRLENGTQALDINAAKDAYQRAKNVAEQAILKTHLSFFGRNAGKYLQDLPLPEIRSDIKPQPNYMEWMATFVWPVIPAEYRKVIRASDVMTQPSIQKIMVAVHAVSAVLETRLTELFNSSLDCRSQGGLLKSLNIFRSGSGETAWKCVVPNKEFQHFKKLLELVFQFSFQTLYVDIHDQQDTASNCAGEEWCDFENLTEKHFVTGALRLFEEDERNFTKLYMGKVNYDAAVSIFEEMSNGSGDAAGKLKKKKKKPSSTA